MLKGYAGQENEQEASATGHIVREVKGRLPEVGEIVFQSDSASCVVLQELIPFIYHLNAQSIIYGSPVILTWIFIEAQTRRGWLDTHFSYFKLILKAFVVDRNDILLEDDIVHDLSFRAGIARTTTVLLDSAQLPRPATSKKFKLTRIGFCATLEARWYQHNA